MYEPAGLDAGRERRRHQALLALSVITGDGYTDEDLAAAMSSYNEAAAGNAYLTGVLMQVLAHHRREDAIATARFIRRLLGDGGGPAGVREPRQPTPTRGSGAAERTLDG